jgi:hypothetical protein
MNWEKAVTKLLTTRKSVPESRECKFYTHNLERLAVSAASCQLPVAPALANGTAFPCFFFN